MSLLRSVGRSVRDWGARETVERSLCKIAAGVLHGGFRKEGIPSLRELCETAQLAATDPETILRAIFDIEPRELTTLRAEFAELSHRLSGRYDERSLHFPRSWAVADGSAFLVYALVRTKRPITTLETGVGNGHSSFYILQALERNGGPGVLHSVEVEPNAGRLIDPNEKGRWKLHLMSAQYRKSALLEILEALPALDLMLHDSDHTYRWIDFELEAALRRMAAPSLILCDDADLTFAWIDFCSRHAFTPALLVDTRKALGIIPVNGPA